MEQHTNPDFFAGNKGTAAAIHAVHTVQVNAQEVRTAAADTMEKAAQEFGEKMSSLASTLRANVPAEGTFGTAARTVADQLESAGSYLQDNPFPHMAQDVAALIKKYPTQSLLVGIGIGYIFSRRFGS